MRVAFVGKGGAGKSSIAGTFARLLALCGPDTVLALDSDPMPGMAFSLGVPHSDAGLPEQVVEQVERDGGHQWRLAGGLTGPQVVARHAVHAPDGVRFLQLGKARGPRWDNSRPHAAFQRLLDDLPGAGWSVVGDLPGGTRQPFMTWGRYARTFLVVVEPTPASVLTGRRLARLATAAAAPRVLAIVNKVREDDDAQDVGLRTGLPVVGAVPFDEAFGQAARTGRPLLELAPDGPASRAIRSIVAALCEQDRRDLAASSPQSRPEQPRPQEPA